MRPPDFACTFRFLRLDPSACRVVPVKSSSSLQGQAATDLDDVVRDHPKANPAPHTFEPSIPAAIQSVASLQHANAAFASGPPALPSSEPTRFLKFSPLAAFGAPTRHRDSNHSHSLDGLLKRQPDTCRRAIFDQLASELPVIRPRREGSYTIAWTLCKVTGTLGQVSDVVPRRRQVSQTRG